MKILIISSFLPFPLYNGGHIRLYNLMKNLNQKHELTLICEIRDDQGQNDIREVSKVCKKITTVKRRKQWSVANVVKSGLTLNPFLITGHANKEMKKAIDDEIKIGSFDLIHVETFYVMQNLPKVNIPVVLVEHNIEYDVYKRYSDSASIFIKPFLLVDIAKLKRIEELYWKKADRLVSVSERDRNVMGKAEVVANGVNLERFKMKKFVKNKKQKKVLFIGDFKWIQNKDSAVYIIKNIWPKVLSQDKNNLDLKLWIVGKSIPDSIKMLKHPTILFDEHASDATELIFQEADLLLSPIRVGGGTSYKILESMACGTPVVTTKLGNEGINATLGDQINIADKPEEFASSVISILSDDYYYEKLSRNGRKFIEENFDWQKIALKLEKVYLDTQKI